MDVSYFFFCFLFFDFRHGYETVEGGRRVVEEGLHVLLEKNGE